MPLHNHLFTAIGTEWAITTNEALSETVRAAIHKCIDDFDQTYSRFRSDSLITQMSHAAGEYVFPDDSIRLFNLYDELYVMSSGKVTPLIGSQLEQAGYDADYSLQPQPLTPILKWDEVITRHDQTLQTTQPVVIDVGACGKGYLVDIICALLDQHSVSDYVVDASGDLRQKGQIDNTVGLEHPSIDGIVIGAVEIRDRSLCASATNRRMWGEFHHVLDPDLMQPTQEIIATWAIANEAILADGLATALFFAKPEILATKYDYEYVRMHKSGAIDYSYNFSGQLF